MGVYQYTMRKDVRVVDGMKIARFSYAYKHGSYSLTGRAKAAVMRLEAAADRAFAAHPDCDYFFMGDWDQLAKFETPVFKMIGDCSFNGGWLPKPVKTMKKVGRKIIIEDITARES